MSVYFAISCGLIAAYVLVGNYLYFCKVLPALRLGGGPPVGPSGLPSVQLRQVAAYVGVLSESSSRPWFYYYLRHVKLITLVLMLILLPLFGAALRNAF